MNELLYKGERRFGRFAIDASAIYERPEEVATLFSMLKVVVLRAEYHPDLDSYLYLCIGPCFDVIEPGHAAPAYILCSEKADDEIKYVKAERIQ